MICVSMIYKHEIKVFKATILTFMENFLSELLLAQYELDLYI